MRTSTGSDTAASRDSELLRSGATCGRSASARAGFMPLALENLILEGLANIPIFLRTIAKKGKDSEYHFTLYTAHSARFTENHRMRLKEAGVKFIYIAMQHQSQFRKQVEQYLEKTMSDPAVAISARSELVYQTSIELVDELLVEQGLAERLPRLQSIAKAVTTLVINDVSAFSHLFAASQHDFYTATHMVNVGTWMVPLAYACGIKAMDELNLICLAGMVHDIGKIFVPEEVLNKPGKLTDDDWAQLRLHPALGKNHLAKLQNVSDLVLRVTLEHHERMDGSGYPARLTGDQMHLASRICAVVDSFDAMTALRPFKNNTMSFGVALAQLQKEAVTKYDKQVMDAWVGLMQRADKDGAVPNGLSADANPALGRRKTERFHVECPARAHRMELAGNTLRELPGTQVTVHNISRSGLGLLSREPMKTSDYLRVVLMGSGSLKDRALEGQIVRCRPFSDGWHEIGTQFVNLEAETKSAQQPAPAATA